MGSYKSTTLDERGQLVGAVEKIEVAGVEIHRHWSPAGVLILEASMASGEYDGHYRSWWNSGALKEEGAYRQGQRCGLYRWYGEDGELLQVVDFGNVL